jgi:ribosomal protein S18 acetylase RimI-like enzyme
VTVVQVDVALARRLERASLVSVPAEKEWEVGGWVCRWGARGLVGRVASACVSPDAGYEPLASVAEVAASYAALGLPALLRLTPLAPERLPGAPALRPARSPVTVMARDLGEPLEADERVTLDPSPNAAWNEAFLSPYDAFQGHARLSLAEAAPGPRRFAALPDGESAAGVALGVIAEGALGIFDVLTLPAHRRRGVGRAVVGTLLAWGQEQGADVAYLQVTASNAPAIALYERLGFTPLYTYSYASVEPSST